MTQATANLLDLIESAYHVGEEGTGAHSVFTHAAALLDADLSPEERALQEEGLARHAGRVERLFGMTGATALGVVRAVGQAVRDRASPTALVHPDGRVAEANAALVAMCGRAPARLADLPFEAAGLDRLVAAMRGTDPTDIFLLSGAEDARPVLALLTPQGALHEMRLTVVVWTDAALDAFAAPFDIPPREREVLRGALLGESQAEIAARLDRSVETIRSQSKSLLLRTGVARMADLVLLATSAALLGLGRPPASVAQDPAPQDRRLDLPDGRRLAYRCYGPEGGAPFLFFHGLQLGPYMTPALERVLAQENIRLIAPSRPGFGETDPVRHDRDFDAAVLTDAQAALEAEGIGRLVVLGHQGGGSHAFRMAARLGERAEGLLMISAGIPIDDAHIASMNAVTRMAALATRRMPALMDMLLRVGVYTYSRDEDGPRRYLEYYFRDAPVDRASLDDPEVFAALRAGALHMIAQGTRPVIQDASAAMADWTADFRAATCRQFWLHGAHCPVMNASMLERYIRTHTNHPIEIAPDSGIHLLYDEPERVRDALRLAAAWLD